MATIVPDTTGSSDLLCAPLRSSGLDGERSRRTRRARTLVALSAVAATAALAIPGVSFASSGDVSIDQAERDRQSTQERQAAVAAQLDAAKANSQDLIAALTTLDQQIASQVARMTEADRAFQDASRRMAEVQAQVDAIQVDVDRYNNELRQQAVRRYVKPDVDDSSVRLLTANNFDEAQTRKVLSDAVAGNSRDLVENLRSAKGRVEVLRQQAADDKAEADARRAEQVDLFNRVLAEREAQGRLQAEWERRVRALTNSQDEINAEAAGIDQAIAAQRAKSGGSAPAAQSSNGRLIRPVNGNPGDGYGGSRNHPGVDILAPVGTPVWAALGGKVVQAVSGGGYNGGYGNLVVIDHPNGLQTRYAHLSTVRVSVGQAVSQGQVIGNVGMTGNTSGPHLHFETYMNGVRQNPANYLP
jgi:murein DD-endopeptidase MepM/ murein hydrolase activator NlpD